MMKMTRHTRGLSVTVPSCPSDADSSREGTTAKLARNVAALFGVPVPGALQPEAPWLCNYNELSNIDIGKGSPPGWAPLDEKKIASATLSKFGPEVKAALVLVGANELLADTMGAMTEVLEVTRLAEDGQTLADACRISIWASLQLDAFVAQPALLMASYKARAVQRAVTARWHPIVDVAPSPPPDRDIKRVAEFAPPARDTADTRRTEVSSLDVVDVLMRQVVNPVAVTPDDGEMSNRLLVEEMINRMLTHLTDGLADASFALISAGEDGRRNIDVFVNRSGLLSAFLDANLRVFNHIHPAGTFDTSVRAAPFDPALVSHWLRLLPRVPSKFELLRSSPAVQTATIRAIDDLIRALFLTSMQMPVEIITECRNRTRSLLVLSEFLLGADHEQTRIVRLRYQELLFSAVRKGPPEEFDVFTDHRTLAKDVIHTCGEVFSHADSYSAGQWLHVVNEVSATLSMAIVNLRDTDPELVASATATQQRVWLEAFSRLGIDPMSPDHDALSRRCEGLTTPLHNWIACTTRKEVPLADRVRAIDTGLAVTLPLRKNLAQIRQHDRPLRYTLQVLGRAIADVTLEENLDPRIREVYVDKLLDIEEQLSSTARTSYLLKIDATTDHGEDEAKLLSTSDILALLAVANIAVRNVELRPGTTSQARLEQALQLSRLGLTQSDGQLAHSDISERLRTFEKRWNSLREHSVPTS